MRFHFNIPQEKCNASVYSIFTAYFSLFFDILGGNAYQENV